VKVSVSSLGGAAKAVKIEIGNPATVRRESECERKFRELVLSILVLSS
jgi:hypothetical protein